MTPEGNQQAIRDNLQDAGCPGEEIERFLELWQTGNVPQQQRFLAQHRRNLLEAMHQEQRQIDCLDYLIRKLKIQGE